MEFFIQKCWMDTFVWNKAPKAISKTNLKTMQGRVFGLWSSESDQFKKIISDWALENQKEELSKSERDLVYFMSHEGPIWIYRFKSGQQNYEGAFVKESSYSLARDFAGSLVPHFKAHQLNQLLIHMHSCDTEIIRGLLVGLELGAYQFKEKFLNHKGPHMGVSISLQNCQWTAQDYKNARSEALAINAARHFVNLPPNVVNPVSFAEQIKKRKWPKNVQINILNEKDLKKQNMNLHLAVGQGSENPPRFVHIKYRPTSNLKNKKQKPLAFVGKGITFDTGGLDIKPSSGMRLMKKDMGGSAVVLALAIWASETLYPRACDFYLSLAENSVDGKSFRPSDVIQSRAGFWVEIDNTDAEGRLVLADGLDYAATQKERPEYLIDVATLTGAIKVALGTDVSGLFSNHDTLAQLLSSSGQETGDYCWRMPLVEKYFSSLNSPFADFKNSGDGFGGAITAALFLQKFAKGIPWAHLDIYAWADKPHGSICSVGGNGQAVQSLIHFCKSQVLR